MYGPVASFVSVPRLSSQVSDKELMNLIRQKVKLALPYAGAFLKKDDRWVHRLLRVDVSHLLGRHTSCGPRLELTSFPGFHVWEGWPGNKT